MENEIIDVDPEIIATMRRRLTAPPDPPHLTMEQCIARYPRLISAMRWVALLTPNEAGACLRDYRDGLHWSGEAVDHFGGTRRVIERAIKSRAIARQVWKG